MKLTYLFIFCLAANISAQVAVETVPPLPVLDEPLPAIPLPSQAVELDPLAEASILLPIADSPVAYAAPAPVLPAAGTRVAVTLPVVNLNGVVRADLAQQLGDSISEHLLAEKHYAVVDLDHAASKVGGPVAPNGVADFILSTAVTAEGAEYRVTLKKLRVSDSVVEAVAKESMSGGPGLIEQLALKACGRLFAAPKGMGPPNEMLVVETFRPPLQARTPAPMLPPDIEFAPTAFREVSPAKQAAIDRAISRSSKPSTATGDPQLAGRITSVSKEFSFCVLKPDKKRSMQVGDRLMTWSTRDPANVMQLTISSVEGGEIIANIPAGAESRIHQGDSVYQWVP